MRVLVTGCAGFIGMHVAGALLDRGDDVVGFDSVNDYYDPELKLARLSLLDGRPGFSFVKGDLSDRDAVEDLFARGQFDGVVHLGAQAGVRHSLQDPHAYVDSNLSGFLNILEACRHAEVKHLVYASSSSVYGMSDAMPFSTSDRADQPVSLYAATKRANELMAHSYSHLFRIPSTGLRFFTVYGPWGRPDMAPMLFARAILAGEPIRVFGHGRMSRDFTYIDDVVDGVVRTLDAPPTDGGGGVPHRVFNLGGGRPTGLLDFIGLLERELGMEADKRLCPMEPGDVVSTWADIEPLREAVGYEPSTPTDVGVAHFVAWYREFYQV